VRRNPLAKVLLPVSSVNDRHDSMDGMYDDNFYLRNPVDDIATSRSKTPLFLSRTWLFKRSGTYLTEKTAFLVG
jgi:esterase/lipase superfamily enzyme